MKLALCNANGEFSYNLTRVEMLKNVVSETEHMKDEDVLLVYTMNKDSIIIDENIMTIHLSNGELCIYDENFVVVNSLSYDDMDYNYFYVLLSGTLATFEYNKRHKGKESRAFEQEQFEQAEAAKESADYRVHIGGNIFRFTGETAADLVYAVIKGIFSSVSRDDDIITIHDAMNGNKYGIAYAKGLAKAVITINGRTRYFDYYIPHELSALMNFIKEVVIL